MSLTAYYFEPQAAVTVSDGIRMIGTPPHATFAILGATEEEALATLDLYFIKFNEEKASKYAGGFRNGHHIADALNEVFERTQRVLGPAFKIQNAAMMLAAEQIYQLYITVDTPAGRRVVYQHKELTERETLLTDPRKGIAVGKPSDFHARLASEIYKLV